MKCPACKYDTLAVPTASYVLEFPSFMPSQNAIAGNTKFAYTYRKHRKAYETLIGHYGSHIPRTNAKPRRVTITRRYGKGRRAYDYGNFVGGCKPLLDALTAHGLIYDDTPTWLADHYAQERSNDGIDWVHILLEELT